ncbi:MAG: N-acetyltransferase [Lachnospiraceae bacterium]|nr:N-acetyltransferase [Lachnospiraceae bacterium]
MITVREVKTRREQREFLNFPLDLYKDNPCFVPPLYGDEKKIFSKNYVYNDMCDAVYYNAYRGKEMVGRISGIIQKASNKIRDEKRVRFTRFDSIDDQEVADALFKAVEDWAVSKGMDTACGPLGFSDLEREGLLIEGFDQLSTFEEQYNADYYGRLIENCGYTKEVDWTESKLSVPDDEDGSLEKMASYIMDRYELHIGEAKNVNDFLKKYADPFFELLDVAYKDIYGTVPFTDGMKKMMISNFKLIIDLKHVAVILDKENRLVCLGLCFPSLAKAIQPSRGHLTPLPLIRLLRAIRHPKILDLGLVAVSPEYANRGVSTIVSAGLMKMLKEDGVEYAETNLNLEDNFAIQNQWKRFKEVKHKRRRSYVKTLAK